jgi:nucleoside-diphosphate-sugar epimerase
MRVLVFGGNRYIGVQLVRELAAAGHDVTVLNSHSTQLPAGVTRLHGNRHDDGVLARLLMPLRNSFDAVFDNTAYTPEHLSRTVDIFRGRLKHFVFTSSIAVYRWAHVLPVPEGAALASEVDPAFYANYGYDKARSEAYLAQQHCANGLPYTAFRISHSLGPLSPMVTREPGTFRRLEEGRPLLVAGKTEAIVHFVHVRDAARAMVSVLGNEQAIGHVYNVAGSDYCSIDSYMRLMAETVGVTPEIITMPAGLPADMRSPVGHWLEARHGSMIFSIEKARQELGWEPEFTLRSGLADSYRWFCDEGRARYEYDYSADDAILTELARRRVAEPQGGEEGDGVRIFQP